MNRPKKLASFCADGGLSLDVGYNIHPNPYLTNPIGIDVEFTQKPNWYSGVVQADICSSPFKRKSFNTIIAGELLEHLEEPYQFFGEVYRLLKKEGRLIISTPNPNSIIITAANWFGIRLPKTHKNEYTKRIVELMGKESGFRKLKLIGLTSLFFFRSKNWAYRFFVKVPLWLLPLSHKIIYVFEKKLEVK